MSDVAKTIRFPDDLFQELKELAAKQNVPFAQLVAQCCEQALAQLHGLQPQEPA